MRLAEKVAIVTGSAGGIGRAIALRFAGEGARVIVADIVDGSTVMEEIRRAGGEAIALRADVSDEESTRAMARHALERFGRIDVLVNNAGTFATLGKKSFMEISAKEWDDVMRINLKSMFLCAQAVYPQMKQQGKGKVINISSSTFFQGVPFFLHYVTSKGGIIGFTRALARETGDFGITVNAVAPGLTISGAVRGNPMFPEEHLEFTRSSRCLKRDETPEDLTGTVLFLASDDSDFVTGQTIIVDGGQLMH